MFINKPSVNWTGSSDTMELVMCLNIICDIYTKPNSKVYVKQIV